MAKSFRIRETGSHIPGMPSDTKGNMIFTPQQVEAIDREENRIRVSGSEQEAMMAMIAAGNLFTQAVPMLEALARHAGVLPRLRQSLTIMRKSIIAMNMHIATRQMGAIASQMADSTITISANASAAHVNIPLEDLLHICNRATETCAFSCMVTRDESKACRLRHALDLVPGCKEASKEIARRYSDRCPYRDVQLESEDDCLQSPSEASTGPCGREWPDIQMEINEEE